MSALIETSVTQAKQHPIVRRAIAGLRRSKDASIELSPVIAEKLREDMRALFDKPELKIAVEDLIQLAFFLDDTQHAHAAAQALIEITSEATPALRTQAKRIAAHAANVRTATAKASAATDAQHGPALPGPRQGGGASIRRH
jgi:hypothetical protein